MHFLRASLARFVASHNSPASATAPLRAMARAGAVALCPQSCGMREPCAQSRQHLEGSNAKHGTRQSDDAENPGA